MTDPEYRTDDDVALSALLDDALPPEESERLRRRLTQEPALAHRLAELRQVDGAVRETYTRIADEPLPHRVVDLLQPRAAASRFRPTTSSGARWFAPSTAIAAGVALAAGFALAFVLLPRTAPLGPLGFIAKSGEIVESSPVYHVLQTVPSSASRALGESGSATPRLSFMSIEGDPCRRLDLTGADGSLDMLACRREGAWRLELIAFGPADVPAPDGVYRPATGGPHSRIDDAIDTLIDGAPLGREPERELISRGWEAAGPLPREK